MEFCDYDRPGRFRSDIFYRLRESRHRPTILLRSTSADWLVINLLEICTPLAAFEARETSPFCSGVTDGYFEVL